MTDYAEWYIGIGAASKLMYRCAA